MLEASGRIEISQHTLLHLITVVEINEDTEQYFASDQVAFCSFQTS